MEKLLIIADDFTGALDTGIQFAAYGARTEIMTDTDMEFGDYPSAEVFYCGYGNQTFVGAGSLWMWFTGLQEKAREAGIYIFVQKNRFRSERKYSPGN